MSGEVEKKEDTDEAKLTASWLRELSLASTHEKKWRDRAEKIIKRYRDEESAQEDEKRSPKFNILYANTEVLRGVIYQKTPIPDVRRRFLDPDKVGKNAAQVLQRALSYCVDAYDFDGMVNQVVEDYLLPGRAVAKIKYVPTFATMNDESGPVMGEDGKPIQQVVYETVETEYVDWEMFRMSPAKRWEKVRWVAFGELLTRDELVKQFGEAGKKCALDWSPKDKENDDEMFKRALVWAIWDKTSKKVYVVSKGSPEMPLKVLDDPLKLNDFFPCPKPLYAIKTTGSMVPIPEYTQYQDQALELDNLTARIEALTEALKRRGLYNASYPEIEKLANAGDNEFIPVEKYSEMIEGGIAAAVWEAPIENLAKVLVHLMQQREAVKQTIYEVTGLADVMRGVSDSSETLGAQQLKAKYANTRTGPRQKDVQVFARDLMRLKAEIIAEKFSVESLIAITGFDLARNDAEKQQIQMQLQAAQQQGQQVQPPAKLKKPTWDQIVNLLHNEQLRGFRIDIETDSTVQPDATEEQKNRVELLGAITQFMQGVAPSVESGAIPMELAKEMLTFGIRAFKVSPQLEDALDQMGGEEGAPPDPAKEQSRQMQTRKSEVEMREMEAKALTAEHTARKTQFEADNNEETFNMTKQQRVNEDAQPQMMQMMQMIAQSFQSLQQTLEKVSAMSELAAAPRELILDNQGMPVGSRPRLQ